MRREKRWTWLAVLAGVATVIAVCGPLPAQPTGDDKALEKSIDAGLRDVINLGATLFNQQDDHAGCFRLFEGALRATKPVLSNYPALQKKIDVTLAEASKQPRMHDRAHTLRKMLDEIRSKINPTVRPVAKTLWDRLGGETGVNKVVAEFLPAAGNDPKVDFTRGGKYKFTDAQANALAKSLVDFISSATGGPFPYKGKSMKDVHLGMGITDEQFDALAGHLKSALEKNGVAPADVSAVLGAVGGTRPDIVEQPAIKKGEDKPPDPPIKKGEEKPPDPPIKKGEEKPPEKKGATLWDRLGGDQGVNKVLADFLPAAATDPVVDFTRGGKFPLTPPFVQALQKSLLDLISAVAGGPYPYTGRSMKDSHKGMGITNEQFDAMGVHLKTALEKNGVAPDDVNAVLAVIGGTRADIVEAPAKKGEDKPPDPPIKKGEDKPPDLPGKKVEDKPPEKKNASLWDRLGGEKGVELVLADFLPAAASDPKVDFTRGEKFNFTAASAGALKKSLLDLISAISGGPYPYTGRSMKDSHKGMGITDEQFDALAGHLKAALEKNGVAPADVNAVVTTVVGTRADIVESGPKKNDINLPAPPIKKVGDEKVNGGNNGPPPNPNVALVQGTVSIGGKALNHGYVTFVNGKGQRFSANVKADGSYIFKRGFPPGDYIILLENTTTAPTLAEVRLPIPPHYGDLALSPLRLSAIPGASNFNVEAK